MKITDEMINPELRKTGTMIRKLFHFKSRKTFERMQRLLGFFRKYMKIHSLDFNEEYIHAGDNDNLRICVYKDKSPKPDAIGLLWIHGGGYGLGTPEQDCGFILNFIQTANCVAVSPDYRLSIEKPYPAALDDCYNTLLWMKNHAYKLGIRDDQLFVGGDSAGGGLAAAVTLLARDKGEVNIAFQMPLYPMIDDRMITESSQDNDAPLWDSHANKVGWQMYLGEYYRADNVPAYAAPSRNTDYSRLPPAYTFVGSIEPFRDETIEYIRNLRNAGVDADIDIYPGAFHAFDLVCSKTEIGQEAIKKYKEKFKYASDHYFANQP